MMQDPYIIPFQNIRKNHLPLVGGKNAAIGELLFHLTPMGIRVPDGFAITSTAFLSFIRENGIEIALYQRLDDLDLVSLSNLNDISIECKTMILNGKLSDSFRIELKQYVEKYRFSENDDSVAVRSSATAEDLPNASFAGQHDSFLFVTGLEDIEKSILKCYASVFNARAIKYRIDKGFDHRQVLISVGVQKMVRSDLAGAGVAFSVDPDTGFPGVAVISACLGLGEQLVQGDTIPDEWIVFKTAIAGNKFPVLKSVRGKKTTRIVKSDKGTRSENVSSEMQKKMVLEDPEIQLLTKQICSIEDFFGVPMDIEWAKDGLNEQMYIVQARPITVLHSKSNVAWTRYELLEHGPLLAVGTAVGNALSSGVVRKIKEANDLGKFRQGDILVAEITHPDWEPFMKMSSGIVTQRGGRTSHAAIVARELGVSAVVGAENILSVVEDGETITIDCTKGQQAFIYRGNALWRKKEIDIPDDRLSHTKAFLTLADPDRAFEYASLPSDGVGLLRLEFIISAKIGIHPMAFLYPERIQDEDTMTEIKHLMQDENPKSCFISRLRENIALIAAAHYPKSVIVRFSDFKSNEYRQLMGGQFFEPNEENPMIGLRGASRYFHPFFKQAFAMECEVIRQIRDEMGFRNVMVMLPFCRTISDVEKSLGEMQMCGLERGRNGLQVYMMTEVPSNAILAHDFANLVDGFSIGSNDLTQLTLGVDRDNEALSRNYDEHNEAVKKLIVDTIREAHKAGITVGFCGQAPSDDPDFIDFLMSTYINSISFSPDAFLSGLSGMLESEHAQTILANGTET
jgi:pyruvate,water dikinase